MSIASVRDWFVKEKAEVARDAHRPVGDIISDWKSTLHPVSPPNVQFVSSGVRRDHDAAGTDFIVSRGVLPEEPGALFTLRSWRARPSTVPCDDDPDLEFGPTRGGFAIRTRSGVLLRDRDRARPQTRSVGGLIDDLTQEMAASRQWGTAGRGTEQVAASGGLLLQCRGLIAALAARGVAPFTTSDP